MRTVESFVILFRHRSIRRVYHAYSLATSRFARYLMLDPTSSSCFSAVTYTGYTQDHRMMFLRGPRSLVAALPVPDLVIPRHHSGAVFLHFWTPSCLTLPGVRYFVRFTRSQRFIYASTSDLTNIIGSVDMPTTIKWI